MVKQMPDRYQNHPATQCRVSQGGFQQSEAGGLLQLSACKPFADQASCLSAGGQLYAAQALPSATPRLLSRTACCILARPLSRA